MERKNSIAIITSVILAGMILISPNKNLLAIITLVISPLVLAAIELISHFAEATEKYIKPKYLAVLQILISIAPVLGIFFGLFGAPFSLPIPFGYYFLVAIIVIILLDLSLMTAIDRVRMSRKETGKLVQSSNIVKSDGE